MAVTDEIGGSLVALRPGIDYTVQYDKNKAATVPLVSGVPAEAAERYRTAVATIKGKGNYRFTIRRTFAVLPRPLSDLTLYMEDKVASGGAKCYQKPKIFLTDGEGRSVPASRIQIVGYEVLGAAIGGVPFIGGEVSAKIQPAAGSKNYYGELRGTYRVIAREQSIARA